MASLVLIASVAILFAGASDAPAPTLAVAGPAVPAHLAPASDAGLDK